MEEAFLLTRVPAYDIRGKALLDVPGKCFIGDHSLVSAVLGYSATRQPGVLDNIVWAELASRGYQVNVGRLGAAEVDFVATKGDDKLYVQVAYSAAAPETLARELAPLNAIQDHFPKYLVTADPLAGGRPDGIHHVPIWDFLLADTY
jgi:predicted AAA+ superfamily ATPase